MTPGPRSQAGQGVPNWTRPGQQPARRTTRNGALSGNHSRPLAEVCGSDPHGPEGTNPDGYQRSLTSTQPRRPARTSPQVETPPHHRPSKLGLLGTSIGRMRGLRESGRSRCRRRQAGRAWHCCPLRLGDVLDYLLRRQDADLEVSPLGRPVRRRSPGPRGRRRRPAHTGRRVGPPPSQGGVQDQAQQHRCGRIPSTIVTRPSVLSTELPNALPVWALPAASAANAQPISRRPRRWRSAPAPDSSQITTMDAPISISESRAKPASATDRAETAAMASTTIPATFHASVAYSSASPRRSSA